jgi:glycosyltransferase involved in cell wall biosynthesis
MYKETNTQVSICIPVFNRENMILDAIKSVQSQTLSDIEIVVVDNASTDNTYSKVFDEAQKDIRIKLYKNESNIGALKNFYRCIELASSEYVVLLGSDDWLEKDFVESRLNGFVLNPDVAIISGPVKIFEQFCNQKVKLKAKYNYPSKKILFDEIIFNFYRKFILSYFCMFRKQDILNSFHFSYDDPFQWGVYGKGLGLDLINCLSIIIKSKSHAIYYVNRGYYCFRNHNQRESEELRCKVQGLNKTIIDFTYNTFLFGTYLRSLGSNYEKTFLRYKFQELTYEIFREIVIYKKLNTNSFSLIKDFIKINRINFLTVFLSLLTLPVYCLKRLINFYCRKLLL